MEKKIVTIISWVHVQVSFWWCFAFFLMSDLLARAQVAPSSGEEGKYVATSTYDPFSDELRGGLNPPSPSFSSSRGIHEDSGGNEYADHEESGASRTRRRKKTTTGQRREQQQQQEQDDGDVGEGGNDEGQFYGPAPLNHLISSSSSSSFKPAASWQGAFPNMVFKTGQHGTGYYLDHPLTATTTIHAGKQQRHQGKQGSSSPNNNVSVTMSRAQYAAELTELLEEFAPDKVDNAAALLRK